MNAIQVSAISDRAIYYYAQDPQVILNRAASNGNMASMTDTRMIAGGTLVRNDRFSTEAETPDIIQITGTTWDNINQNISTLSTADPADTNNIRFPVYLDDDNNIRSMTQQDFIDTFISPAIINLTKSSSSNDRKGGTYEIHSNKEFLPISAEIPSHLELVNAFPIYINTIADTSVFDANFFAGADQPLQEEFYYLYKYKGFSTVPDMLERPLFITANSDANLREYSDSMLDGLLEPFILHQSKTIGNKITYAITTSSTANNRRGTMVDSRLSGTSAEGYTQLQIGDSYYTREFPNGIETAATTYYLTCSRV
jgi:hypothetical protein